MAKVVATSAPSGLLIEEKGVRRATDGCGERLVTWDLAKIGATYSASEERTYGMKTSIARAWSFRWWSPPSAILLAILLIVLHAPPASPQEGSAVRIGSKSFTESVLLGEMLRVLSQHAGADTTHRRELGGTQILWQALLSGDIDAYVEYSGTLREEILLGQNVGDLESIRSRLEEQGIRSSEPLGFNNTYALGMTERRAAELGIDTISDLRQHPDLKFGFSDEFVQRNDGWTRLKARYQLPHTSIRTLDHSLAYRGVRSGSIDVIDLYSTDAEIISFQLKVLEDDLSFFPLYEAIILYRAGLEKSHPQVVRAFRQLEGRIDDETMARLNERSRVDRIAEPLIAARFLQDRLDPTISTSDLHDSWITQLLRNSWQHLFLVCLSLSLAIVCAVPLGVAAYKFPKLGRWILGAVGIIQTIPSLALMVFLIPLLGLGAIPAIMALFLYSLLPIVRGTHTGLAGLDPSVHESALALGLSSSARLRLIELPLAAQSILSGIKTSAVINVGTATIGALIGAGGYGQPILTGIRLDDIQLILQGAIPAAALALFVEALFGWAEKALVPLGLRLDPESENPA